MGIETAECVVRVEADLFSPHLAQFLHTVFLYLQIQLADVLNLLNHFVKSTFGFHPMRLHTSVSLKAEVNAIDERQSKNTLLGAVGPLEVDP